MNTLIQSVVSGIFGLVLVLIGIAIFSLSIGAITLSPSEIMGTVLVVSGLMITVYFAVNK